MPCPLCDMRWLWLVVMEARGSPQRQEAAEVLAHTALLQAQLTVGVGASGVGSTVGCSLCFAPMNLRPWQTLSLAVGSVSD